MSVLFCSVGRRAKLLTDFKKTNSEISVLATDCSQYAPGLYSADKKFITPRVD